MGVWSAWVGAGSVFSRTGSALLAFFSPSIAMPVWFALALCFRAWLSGASGMDQVTTFAGAAVSPDHASRNPDLWNSEAEKSVLGMVMLAGSLANNRCRTLVH
jgi:hypothetical protein